MTTAPLRISEHLERLNRRALAAWQAQRLAALLERTAAGNPFYQRRFADAGVRLDRLRLPEDLRRLPLATKSEFVEDQERNPPWGTNLSAPIVAYTRYSQTSSTTGRPLRWLDTDESWRAMVSCWISVYRAARVTATDRLLFAFGFGPFAGFWTAFEAGCQLGAHCVPGGGLSTEMRLAMIEAVQPTVLLCTPTYALRLADAAAAQPDRRQPLSAGSVRLVVVAGEPGGNIPSTRARIERSWGARVLDQYGLTEAGPLTFECIEGPGFLHLIEHDYLCEVLDPVRHEPVPDGVPGELVVTNLRRGASPVIRYRTGDLVVRTVDPCVCGRTWSRLVGGVVGRIDDMVTVRGVNVYPSAIEAVVRTVDGIVEYRATVSLHREMQRLTLEIELAPDAAPGPAEEALVRRMREAMGLTPHVEMRPVGSLPRFEMKARRFRVEPCPGPAQPGQDG